ncbi:MAG: hypothetical protein Q8N03_07165 [Ignavibacteria bacterium]|nr:hypothetical protein [Ignavibacteria bacterium]
MILETLDVKNNDIFIYSENKFDLANNFKLINKDAKVKKPIKIHYNDVIGFINDHNPKNLVMYRLLTNITDFDVNLIKYGQPINVNGIEEFFHFDPIFAIKELEQYGDLHQYPFLRFRIQQVGLITQLRSFGKVNYTEVYCFDLLATEARWQNDRVFAEMIFAFDSVDFSSDKLEKPISKVVTPPITTQRNNTLKPLRYTNKDNLVEEVKDIDGAKVKKLSTTAFNIPPSTPRFQRVNSPKVEQEQERQPVGKPNRQNLQPAPGPQSTENKTTSPQHKKLSDLFKSSKSINDFIAERGKQQIVLKLKEEEKNSK